MLADRVRMGRKKYNYTDEVYLAQDSDFVKVNNYWVYRGSELEIEIPHIIQGENVTEYNFMFCGMVGFSATPVTRVVSNNKMVTNMIYMFYESSATTLDLSSFDTSNVTNMSRMFQFSSATTLDLSSFDTSNVTNMGYMFNGSSATTLDLSSFDTSNVTNMSNMFYGCSATTGYARTQEDADRFNNSSGKPSALIFVVK
jgi:surface protein